MADFSADIANYINYGVYNYKFDAVGNELLNPSSSIYQQVYFSLPLWNVEYDEMKMASFYDANFSEFVEITGSASASVFPQEAIDQINSITFDNVQLQNQLNAFINASEQDSGAADVVLVRETIIALRIQLGQGSVASDFDTTFPYPPIPIQLRDTTTNVQVVPSSAATTVQPTITTETTIVSNTSQISPNMVVTESLGELTDAEKAVISASMPSSGGSQSPGSSGTSGKINYVIASSTFGTVVINGITYYRLILVDSPTIAGTTGAVGFPIHGKYVNVPATQYLQLTDRNATIDINGIQYKNLSKNNPNLLYSFQYWLGYDYQLNNGNSVLANYERWNNPSLMASRNGRHFTRDEQVGYMGALGPP